MRSYLFARLQQLKTLKAAGMPVEQIKDVQEGVARQFARLPVLEQAKAIKQVLELTPKAMKALVDDKLGKEEWATLARRLPAEVVGQVEEAERKLAGMLGVDLDSTVTKTRVAAYVEVYTALAQLVLTTDESRLIVEVRGDEAHV